MLKLSYKFK